MKLQSLILSAMVFAAVAFSSVSVAQAQTASAAQEIAIVDIQALMRESEAGKSIQKQVTTIREDFKKTIATKEKELRASEKELISKKSSLSPEQFNAEKEKFEKNLVSVQKEVLGKQQALDKSFGEAMDVLRNEAVQIIAAKAKAKNASLVLPRQNIIIVEQELDLTAEVMKELNAKLKTVAVKK